MKQSGDVEDNIHMLEGYLSDQMEKMKKQNPKEAEDGINEADLSIGEDVLLFHIVPW